jgi:hypothetical protein
MQVSPYIMMQRYLLGGVTATVASVVVVHNLPMALNSMNKDRKSPRDRRRARQRRRGALSAAEKERGRTAGGGRRGDNGPGVWGRRGCRQRDSISGPSFFCIL